jgi:hypothetical protein
MSERISRSWGLVKASAEVLRSDKELIIFPVISVIGVMIVIATFALPLFFLGYFEPNGYSLGPEGYLIFFLFYLVEYFVIIYANTALVGAALMRLKGGNPTVQDGFRIASSRMGAIFGYAAISATIGLVLRWFSERGSLGAIAASLFGLAWGLATFLAVPILVAEDVGPLDAIKRSTSLLRKTWGEQIVGNFSIGLIFGLFFIAAAALGIIFIYLAGQSGLGVLTIPILVAFVLLLIGIGLISSALSGIFAAAVYSYATTGSTGGFFKEDLIRGAFRSKASKSYSD